MTDHRPALRETPLKKPHVTIRRPGVTRPAAASAAGKTLASPQATAAEKKAAAAALRETPLKKTKK
jgi:hypothetical protein